MLGSKMLTICDQALYRVSSQMDVLKHCVLSLKSLEVASMILYIFSVNISSRMSSLIRSILWMRTKILAFCERSVSALRQFT